MSQRVESEEKVEIVSLRRTAGTETSSSALASRSKASRVPSASNAPCTVSFRPRGRRSNSFTPSRSSSCFTCRLTAAWVTFISCAAALRLRLRAATSKARSGPTGMRFMGLRDPQGMTFYHR